MRGSTYASNEYIEKMNEYGLVGSMNRTGNCWNNAPIESFWGRMKVNDRRLIQNAAGGHPGLI